MGAIATTVTRGLAAAALLLAAAPAFAGPLDELDVERWKKLREAERFQLTVAEKLYRARPPQYKVAADEYEKFLKLYETSEGAAYAQLMWAHCQVEQRKLNAAIKDGYQTVLDYFPDSPEAPLAALLIGRTHRAAGDTKLAKVAYTKAVKAYPAHFAAVMARYDLVDIAVKENDAAAQVALLRELTFDVPRKGPTVDPCERAALQLSGLSFRAGDFDDGLKALATTCKEEALPAALVHPQQGKLPAILSQLTGATEEAPKKAGEKLAAAAAGWLKTRATSAPVDEKTRPRAVEAWLAAADVRRAARQPDKEKELYDQMLAAVGADDTVLDRVAEFHKRAGQYTEARAVYGKFKDATEGKGRIAASFAEEKKYDEAAALYRQLALADDKRAGRWLGAAAAVYRPGQPDKAIAIYRELLTADAANAGEYHFQIAETLFFAHRWQEAITAYRGTDRFPLNTQRMAQAHRHLKQYDEAIGLYRQIIAAAPGSAPDALLAIAQTNEQAGRKEEAIKVFKQVCDKFPKTGEGSQAHSILNEKYKIPVTLGGAKD